MRSSARRFYIVAGMFALVALCTVLLGAQVLHVREATIIVTNTNDGGPGSLRQALADAHDGDIIGFDPALNGHLITLTSAELVVNKNITITGPGFDLLSVERSFTAPNFRVFHVIAGHTVTIEQLSIKFGDASGSTGGGILNEG